MIIEAITGCLKQWRGKNKGNVNKTQNLEKLRTIEGNIVILRKQEW